VSLVAPRSWRRLTRSYAFDFIRVVGLMRNRVVVVVTTLEEIDDGM
jgi:hypothetical protein